MGWKHQQKDKDCLSGYKTRPLNLLSTRDPAQTKGHKQTESEGLKKIFHTSRDQKKAGVAILISDKIDFKTKAMKRDKEDHYIMIKGSIQEEDIAIINIDEPNIGATAICKTNSPTIIVLLLISHFILVSICLTYCGASMLGAYIFIIVILSSWIDPLIIM